jgi:hypothetical protein
MLKRVLTFVLLALCLMPTAASQGKALRVVFVTSADTRYGITDERAEAAFEGALRKQFIAAGHTVLDASQLANNQERTLAARIFQGDASSAITLATSLKVDAIVASRVGSSQLAQQQIGFVRAYAYRATGDVRVILASTAQIVASATADATGTGASEGDAQFSAFGLAGEGVGRGLVDQLKRVSSTAQSVSIELTVTGVRSFGDANLLLAEIGKQPGVNAAERRTFSSGVLVADVQFTGKVDDFAALLEGLSLVKLEVTGVSGMTVEAKVRQ